MFVLFMLGSVDSEAFVRRCSSKQMFLKILQISQETIWNNTFQTLDFADSSFPF